MLYLGHGECLLQELSLPALVFPSLNGHSHVWMDLGFYQRLGSGVSLTSEERQAPVPQNCVSHHSSPSRATFLLLFWAFPNK